MESLATKVQELCVIHRALEEGAKRAGRQLEDSKQAVLFPD